MNRSLSGKSGALQHALNHAAAQVQEYFIGFESSPSGDVIFIGWRADADAVLLNRPILFEATSEDDVEVKEQVGACICFAEADDGGFINMMLEDRVQYVTAMEDLPGTTYYE